MTEQELFRELEGLDPEMILDAAPKRRSQIPRRLAALAACLAVIFGLLWAVGFDNVYAGMRTLFSFIPGIGIQESSGVQMYSWDPITDRIERDNHRAQLLMAAYLDGTLSATVEIKGTSLQADDFEFYRNGEAQALRQGDEAYYSLAVASNSAMVHFAIPMQKPEETDLFEIAIHGFDGKLAFALRPCETFEQLEEIGPTVTRHGISLTATAHRFGSELVVWCYDTCWDSRMTDTLVGIGQPINSGYSLLRYLETESGHIRDTTTGWSLRNRMVFQLPESDRTATLHIPYLAMFRKEAVSVNIRLPEAISYPNTPIGTSLGTIRIASLERQPYGEGKSQILIGLAYENTDAARRMYGFEYSLRDCHASAARIGGDDGLVQYIEVIVDADQTSLELSIKGIYYYWMEEYVIPLDIHQ